MSDIKWIPLTGMNLSAANLAAAEKLRKFGFAVNCGEFGSEKLTKAGLCIYDILQEKDNPNILIITSGSELYGWYRILMTTIGADFKIITGAPNALVFFDKSSPNLFLMSRDALFVNNAIKDKAGDGFLWDLIIIDEEQHTTVPEYAVYEKNIPWKTEKLLINTPFPCAGESDREALISLIRSVLDDKSLAAQADDISFTADAAGLDGDSPVMRCFAARSYTPDSGRNVSFREYSFDDEMLKTLRRRVDLRSGLPTYKYGGNIFEEYDCEKQKKLYLKPSYIRSEVEDLREFDKKLDCFLTLMDELTKDEGSRVMVYCCEKGTLDYLRKVLTCLYGNDVRVARSEIFRSEDIIRKLRVDDSTVYPKIILGTDALGAVGEGLDRINCIVSYELPESPVMLERRCTRHGSAMEADRKFIFFRDTNRMFDARMLEKVLFPAAADGFCGELPSRSILFDIPEKGEYLNNVIADLKYIEGYASEIDNCFDLIKKVKCDYSDSSLDKIANSRQLVEFAEKTLDKLFRTFGLTRESTAEEITAAAESLNELCALNGEGRIEKLPADKLAALGATFEGDGYLSQSFASEAVSGLAKAKEHIDVIHSSENFHLKVKQELNALTDCIQYPVLFGIWKYRVREQGSRRSFRDYIKIYNDGI